MVIFILIRFSSVAVSASLQEVLNVAKFIADIHQELPNSCLFIINSEKEVQGENKLYFSRHELCLFGSLCSDLSFQESFFCMGMKPGPSQ
jgi:hypothetical protein